MSPNEWVVYCLVIAREEDAKLLINRYFNFMMALRKSCTHIWIPARTGIDALLRNKGDIIFLDVSGNSDKHPKMFIQIIFGNEFSF